MRPCRSPFSPPRSTSVSALAARPISRTSCSRRCVTSSADTWRKLPANNRARSRIMAAISRAPEVGAEAVDLGQIARRQHHRETRAVRPFEEYTTAGCRGYNRSIRFGQNDLGRQFEEGGLRLFQRGLLSRWFGDRLFQSL